MVIRISGLSSGLNTDQMVSDLMKAERIPLDQMYQKQQTLTWKEEAYRGVNTNLATFRSFLQTFRFSSNWNQMTTSSSNSAVATATANSTAGTGTHTVNSITQLANGAILTGGAVTQTPSLVSSLSIAGSTTISSTSSPANNQFNVTLDGAQKTVTIADGTYATAADLQTAVQSAVDQSFGANKITVGLNASNQLQLTPNGTTGYLPQLTVGAITGNNGLTTLGFTDQQSFKVNVNAQLGAIPSSQLAQPLTYGTFSVNGQTITYGSTDSISSIMSQVNNSAAGVNMSYDSITDKFTFTTKGTGAAAQVNLQDGTGNFLTDMGALSGKSASGQDAIVSIDGVTSNRSTNNFTISGVSYTLSGTTATPVSIGVNQDSTAIYNKIKDFVSKYNDLVGPVASKLIEPKYRSYKPLTSDQKSAMNAADITLWEDKAKSGLLQNDSILQGISTKMRSFLSESVQSISTTSNALYKIGITTMPYNSSSPQDAGKLTIDDAKLKAAIQQDPSGVISLFTNQPNTGTQTGTALSGSTTVTSGVNDQFSVNLNGTTKVIQLTAGTYTNAGMQTELQNQLNTSLGTGKITVNLVGGSQLQLAPASTGDSVSLANVNNGLSAIGFQSTVSSTGIGQAMYDQTNSSIQDLVTKAGGTTGASDDINTYLGLQVHNLNSKIDLMKVKLTSKEDYYYKMFTTMEQAMQKGNAELSWLTQQGH